MGDLLQKKENRELSEIKIFVFFIIFLAVLLTTSLIENALLVAIAIIAAFYIFKITHKWFFLTSFALLVNTGILLALNMQDVAITTASIAFYLMLIGIVVEIINY